MSSSVPNHSNLTIITIMRKIGKNLKEYIGKKTSFLNEYEWVRRLRGFPAVNISFQDANDLISEIINNHTGKLIARIGGNELDIAVIRDKRQVENKMAYPEVLSANMHQVAGFFPPTPEFLDRFGDLYLSIFPQIDMLASWRKNESDVAKYFNYEYQIDIRHLEAFRVQKPWTDSLAGKKVLVISPFERTIISQYQKRDRVFIPKLLPTFELVTYKPIVSHGGNSNNVGFSSWFDALNFMKDDILKLDYDVALISAGAYGLPLGNYIKQEGKNAIVLGGITQFFFGIQGRRWDSNHFYSKYYNAEWVRPLRDEIPPNPELVEGSAYF